MKKRTSDVPPLESDPSRDLWFWQHTREGGRHVEFSNKPHPLLPHHCAFHGYYSNEPCTAAHDAAAKAWIDGRAAWSKQWRKTRRAKQRKPGLAKTRPPAKEIAPRRRAGRS
jgi:hypothetical protein